jgi:hypothetical protein
MGFNLPLLILRRRLLGSAAFTPATLFSFGEQGVWFDPSDVANLDWRRNLLERTEQFDDAYWTKGGSTIAASSIAAPDGTLTADKLAEDTSTGVHRVLPINGISVGIGAACAWSIYAKAAERTVVRVSNNNLAGATFDLSNNALPSDVSSGITPTATPVGNGWFRLVISGTAATGTERIIAQPVVGGNTSYAGTAGFGILIWGAQLELGSVATTYQPITDVNAEARALFPNATLYQDAIGTQPVTTPGQPVGLMLDKSRGLALGPELRGAGVTAMVGTVTAATYNTTTGVGTVTRVDINNQSFVQWTGLTTPYCRISVTCTSGLSITVRQGTFAASGTVLVPGESLTFYSPAPGGTVTITGNVGTNGFTVTTIKEIPGNHAVQATGANRPNYGIEPQGGRRNLLLSTDVPEAGTGLTVTIRAAVAPDGTNNAVRVTKTDSTTPRYTFQNWTSSTPLPNTVYTVSRYVKYDGFNTTVSVEYNTTTTFDLGWIATFSVTASGVTADTPSLCTSAVQDVGNGWYRIRATFTSGASPASSTTPMLSRVTGASGVSVLMYGAQIELGSTATPYQKVTTQYDVTEAGVPPVSYLFFNGNNFSMSTPSINFPAGPTNPTLGPELVTNGDFSQGGTGWQVNAGWSITGGAAVGAATNASLLGGGVTPVAGRTYRVDFDVVSYTSGFLYITVGGNFSGSAILTGAAMAPGRKSVYVVSESSPARGVEFYGGAIAATIDNISVREIDAAYAPDKVSVFAGVRKLSDANAGMVAELSSIVGTNAGTFYLTAPETTAPNGNFSFKSRGSVNPLGFAQTSIRVAPVTAVVSGLGDIAADIASIRYNGEQTNYSADQGAGTLGNYPLYIGHRFNNPPSTPSSLFFSGHLYSLIVRGAQSTTTQITNTETWVAGETGFFVPAISGVPTVGIS